MLTVARVILVFLTITGIYYLSPAHAGQLFPPANVEVASTAQFWPGTRIRAKSGWSGAYRHQCRLLRQSGSRQLSKQLQHA